MRLKKWMIGSIIIFSIFAIAFAIWFMVNRDMKHSKQSAFVSEMKQEAMSYLEKELIEADEFSENSDQKIIFKSWKAELEEREDDSNQEESQYSRILITFVVTKHPYWQWDKKAYTVILEKSDNGDMQIIGYQKS